MSRARVSCGLLRPCHQPSSHPQPQRVLGGSSSGRGGVSSAGRPPRALPQADEEEKPGPGSRARHTSCVCCGPNPPWGPCRAPRTPESSPAGPRCSACCSPRTGERGMRGAPRSRGLRPRPPSQAHGGTRGRLFLKSRPRVAPKHPLNRTKDPEEKSCQTVVVVGLFDFVVPQEGTVSCASCVLSLLLAVS